MRETLECCAYFLAWEWINIALEYTSVAWVRLPRLFLAVVGVNLLTHPVLMCLLDVTSSHLSSSDDWGMVVVLELIVFLVEWACLTAVYGWSKLKTCAGTSLLMNLVSFATGVLLQFRP